VLTALDAKRILQEAIYNDTKYLCSQSIMDYSLLLGLDDARKELVVGLVDAIGSYNLFKTIESRGKLALNRGGEVTIVGSQLDLSRRLYG
jgi:1-phosphatidylinositol-3-phosphate 5-kinase